MPLVLPWQAHVPDPAFLRDLAKKRVMLDVGTLLRGLLFRESHSARLLEHIQSAHGAKAFDCRHAEQSALRLIHRKRPELAPEFSSKLLERIKSGVIEMVPDGDPKSLPAGIAFDRGDDDIIIASALAEKCDALSTLDHRCAEHAAKVLSVLAPCHPEANRFFSTQTTIDVPFFSGGTEGTLLLEVMPQRESVGHSAEPSGRRYVFATDGGLAAWLSESSWRYEVGFTNSGAVYTFDEIPLDRFARIAVSYDCDTRRLVVGSRSMATEIASATTAPAAALPANLGNRIHVVSFQNQSFWGYWRGVLSTAKFIGAASLKNCLTFDCYFEPLDAQRFRIEDALHETARLLTPEMQWR